MKVVLSFDEVKALKKIANAVEETSAETLLNSLKNNKLITCNVDMFNQKVTVTVNKDYVAEYLEVYGKYINLFVKQTQSIIKLTEMLAVETEGVVNKYTREEKKVK